ncbi:MAG: hypothetical protein PHH98_03500 [Candidatus Gracilibacteria bacterium]|nr:hypothetical protein [Candidatus Gracilibacteria bacterium]
MENNINSSNVRVVELIENISSLVFDEKIWFGNEIWKIAEVTYSYANIYEKNELKINGKEININTTLYVSLGELNLDEFISSDDNGKNRLLKKASKIIKDKIIEKKSQIRKGLLETKKIDTTNLDIGEKNKLEILIDSLYEKLDLLNYCLNGLVYEDVKAGIKRNISEKREEKIDKKQRNLDKKLFGGEIKDNEEEVGLCYNHLYNIYLENKSKLTNDEIQRLEGYIKRIKNYLPNGFQYKEPTKLENRISDLEKYNLSQRDYILGFNLFIEAFSKMDFNVETNPFVKSISDGPNGFQIPTSEKFQKFTLTRFLLLNAHENETHNISEYNSKNIIGNTRGKDSTTKEEGVAKLMENMLKFGNQLFKIDLDAGKTIFDLEKFEMADNFVKTLFGEVLQNAELLDFLQLYEKIKKDIISPKDRFDRLKRSNNKGVQHKDTTYTRGLFQVASEINKYILSDGETGIEFYDLFIAKVGLGDIKKVKEIKDSKGIETLKPIFSSDIVYFFIRNNLDGKKTDLDKFLDYLKNKYPILDFTQEIIDLIVNETHTSINGIINLGLKNIYDQEINKTISETRKKVSKVLIEESINKAIELLAPKRRKALVA